MIVKNSGRGFTIIELVMVIVLAAILAIVAVPSFQNYPRTKAQAAAFRLRSDLRYAQIAAMQTQRNMRVLFNAAGNSYQVQIQDTVNPALWTTVTNPGTRLAYQVLLNTGDFTGVTFSAVNFNGTAAVAFDSSGRSFDLNNSPISGTGSAALTTYSVFVEETTGRIGVTAL